MSLQLSDTTTDLGIIQQIEDELDWDRGDILNNTALLKKVVAKINLAWDDYLAIALTASGKWQYDDSSHTDYPIIYTNLVSGQRSYLITTDEQGNLVLDIYKAAILPSATATLYEEIFPKDQQTKNHAPDLVSESTATGVPHEYDKTANGIFLDPPPSYNATNGLKLYINREASRFTTSDLTKKPGCPGLHHEYFVFKAAHAIARPKGLTTKNDLAAEIFKYEGDKSAGIQGKIARYFAQREKDEKPRIKPAISNFI